MGMTCGEEEGRFPNRPYGNDGWERYAAVGMTCGGNNGRGRGEIGRWEGVFHGGMVAGEGDYSQWEDVRGAEGRGSVGAQRDSSTSLRCAQNDMWGALGMRCGEEEGRFPNRPYGNDGWERYAVVGMTCGGNNGRAVPEPPLRE